jgi:hypothetical protein
MLEKQLSVKFSPKFRRDLFYCLVLGNIWTRENLVQSYRDMHYKNNVATEQGYNYAILERRGAMRVLFWGRHCAPGTPPKSAMPF